MVLDDIRQQPPLLLLRQNPLHRQAPDRLNGSLRHVSCQFPLVNSLLIIVIVIIIIIINLDQLPPLKQAASVKESQSVSFFTQSSPASSKSRI